MKIKYLLSLMLVTASAMSWADASSVERGRYLVNVGSCNDCHTVGFPESMGATPEAERLMGSPVGYAGPWGVSYPANLRLSAQRMSKEQWLQRVSNPGLPPMPWPAMMAMTTEDKLAVYDYLQSLGPAGHEAPASVAPGQPIPTMYVSFEPHPAQTDVSAAVSH